MENKEWEELQQNKIADRQSLLSIDPKQAQLKVNNILRPDLWSVDTTTAPYFELDYLDNLLIPNLDLMKHTPNNIKNIIKALQREELNLVLVGGQAINFWATHYQQSCTELSQFIPFTSEDIDFLGGRLEASIAHEILGGNLVLNKNFDPSPNAGVLVTNLNNSSLRIDFLASVYGLNEEEIVHTALVYEGKEELESIKLAILNPILCLEGKLAAVVGLPQYNRQDIKHLKMSILIVKSYLSQICKSNKPRTGLKLVERIYNRAKSDAGLQVNLQNCIDIEAAIPLKLIEQLKDESWQKFSCLRLPQLQQQLSDRQSKYSRLMKQRKLYREQKHKKD